MNLRQIYDQLAGEYSESISGETVHSFSDKGGPHTYIEFYEKYMQPRRAQARILEIGVKTGGSLLLWSRYFDRYRIVGVDIEPTWSAPRPFQSELEANPSISVRWNQDSTEPWPQAGNFDFVIDDGAHDVETQSGTFTNCWDLVAPGGTYFIEDVVSEAAAQDLIQRIFPRVQGSANISRYIGNTRQRADDQILVITRT